MLYCAKCWEAFAEGRCPVCGGRKNRPLREEDPVFLMETDGLWVGAVEEMLRDNGVPTMRKGRHGAFLTAVCGPVSEIYEIGVPFADLEKAKALVEVFSDCGSAKTGEEG